MGIVNEALISQLPAHLDSFNLECLEENDPVTQMGQKRSNHNARLSS